MVATAAGPALAATTARGAGGPAVTTVTTWPAYLYGPAHSSYAAGQKIIKPATVPTLVRKWHFVPSEPTKAGGPTNGFLASPIVSGGAIFIGSKAGWFYKLSEWTGKVLAKRYFGYQPTLTCTALGIVSTATVATDPKDGTPTVYVAAPDGYLYALRATNLTMKWRSVIAVPSTKSSNYFDWSSPTVANGKIYVGVSSNCDTPLVPGGVVGFNQATGKRFARFFTMPGGKLGGSVWSSVAVDSSGYVYATTGNPAAGATGPNFAESIVKLAGTTLKPLAKYTVPKAQVTGDGDFGGSPTIFGQYVGACDKNGIYYALKRSTMGLAWQRRIGAKSSSATPAQCSAAAIYDGKYLYAAGPAAKIGSHAYRGSISRLNPATGAVAGWQTGLPNGVIGSPTMDGGGVIAVGTYDVSANPNAMYLVNAATGKILRTLIVGFDFSQGAFAGGMLFTAKGTGVYGWGPK